MGSDAMDGSVGSARGAVSTRTRVMRFVRLFQEQNNGWTPSLGRIADELHTTKTTIVRTLDSLERDAMILRLPAGEKRVRPIVFPDAQARAVALLEQLGWKLAAPTLSPVTDAQLPVGSLLGQIDLADQGVLHGALRENDP